LGNPSIYHLRYTIWPMRDITIGPFSSNCSCTTANIGNSNDGTITLKPGEKLDSHIRVVVREAKGVPLRNEVRFATSDPKTPQGKIVAEVTKVYGLVAVPPQPFALRDGLGELAGEFTITPQGFNMIELVTCEINPPDSLKIESEKQSNGSLRFRFSQTPSQLGKKYCYANLKFLADGKEYPLEIPILLEAREVVRISPRQIGYSHLMDSIQLSHSRILITAPNSDATIVITKQPTWLEVKRLQTAESSSISVFELHATSVPIDAEPQPELIWDVTCAGKSYRLVTPIQRELP
jgi:hypothetical protein